MTGIYKVWAGASRANTLLFLMFLLYTTMVVAIPTPNYNWPFENNENPAVGSLILTQNGNPKYFTADPFPVPEANYAVNLSQATSQYFWNDSIGNAADEFSVSTWIKVNATDATGCQQDPIYSMENNGGFGILSLNFYKSAGNWWICWNVGDGSSNIVVDKQMTHNPQGVWTMVTATTKNSDVIALYINDTQIGNTSIGTKQNQQNRGAIGTQAWNLNGDNINAQLDNLSIWKTELTSDDVVELYGARSSGPNVPDVTELIVTAVNQYGGSQILNLSVNVSNATHSYLNATTDGTVKFSQLTNLTHYNVTLSSNSSGGYFNTTNLTLVNLSTTLNVNMTQAYIVFNASRGGSGTGINGLNLSAEGYTAISDPSQSFVAFLANNTNITITANATGHLQQVITINYSALTNTTYNLTFFDMFVNVTLYNPITNDTLDGFDLSVRGINTSEYYNFTTATSSVTTIPLTAGFNYTFNITRANTFVPNRTFVLPTTPSFFNLSLFGQEIHTLYIEIFDESSHNLFWPYTPLDNETVNIQFISDAYQNNYTTNNGTLFATNLTPGFYELRYSAPSFDARSYFINIPTGGAESVDLFLLNQTLSTLVVFNIVDENDKDLNGTILYVQRRYVDLNKFEIVEMARADFNGEAVTNIVLNDQFYRFLVTDASLNPLFDSSTEVKITSQTPQIRVQLAGLSLQPVTGISGLYVNEISRNEDTFSVNVFDSGGVIAGSCIKVSKLTYQGATVINETCQTSSGVIDVSFDTSVNGDYNIIASINQTDNNLAFSNYPVSVSGASGTYGSLGALIGLLILMFMAVLYTQSPAITVLFGLGGLVVSAALGIIAGTVGSILGLMVIAMIFVFGGRR